MKKFGRILIILLLLATTLMTATGCQEQKSFLPMLDTAFRIEIKGTCGGIPVSGFAEASEWTNTDTGRIRQVRMIFTAPDSLRGITVSCDSFNMDTHTLGPVTASADGVTIQNTALAGLLTPALLLAAAFPVTNVTTDKNGNTAVSGALAPNSRIVTITPSGILLYGSFDGVLFEVGS